MKPNFVSIGAVCAALGIALGAFGAHALRSKVGPYELSTWETATRYWLVAALGLVSFGVFQEKREQSAILPGLLLLGGGTLFSASLYALALGAPRALGAVTPFGGAGLIAGFVCFALHARRR